MTDLPAGDDLVRRYAALAGLWFEADAAGDEVALDWIETGLKRFWYSMAPADQAAARKAWLAAKAEAPGTETRS